MTIPAAADLPNYPWPTNARTFDAEFIRMMMQASGIVEGVAPATPGVTPMADYLVTTGSSGLNVSVAAGRAFVQGDTRTTQGLYFCYNAAAQTVTLPAAHATLPRIDAIVLKVEDADVSGSATRWSATYQQGTPTASAHIGNPTAASWLAGAPGQSGGPALSDNCFVLAYVLVPATFTGPFVNATHIKDCRTHYLGRPMSYITTADTTTSSSYVQLGTNGAQDGIWVRIRGGEVVRLGFKAQWKISAASGSQTIAFFLNGNQLKYPARGTVPLAVESAYTSLATFYSHITTAGTASTVAPASIASREGVTTDVSDVTTGMVLWAESVTAAFTPATIDIIGLAAGLYYITPQFKTSANTLSVRERRLWAHVLAQN